MELRGIKAIDFMGYELVVMQGQFYMSSLTNTIEAINAKQNRIAEGEAILRNIFSKPTVSMAVAA